MDVEQLSRSSTFTSTSEPLGSDPTEHKEFQSLIAGLPSISVAGDFTWAPGPHDTCNYLFPNRKLLAGSYPGGRQEPEHSAKIQTLVDTGVNCFVCLQEHQELTRRFTPYVSVAQELALRKFAGSGEDSALEFLHCPIPDAGVTDYEALSTAVAVVIKKLQEGRTVYVHCWGGHGRTGTLLCALLTKAYGLSAEEARSYFMAAHRQRRIRGGGGPGHWPHSQAQYDQVVRMSQEGSDFNPNVQLPKLENWQKERKRDSVKRWFEGIFSAQAL